MKISKLTILLLMAGLALLLNLYFLTGDVYAKDDQKTKTSVNKSKQSAQNYKVQKRLKELGYDPGQIDGI